MLYIQLMSYFNPPVTLRGMTEGRGGRVQTSRRGCFAQVLLAIGNRRGMEKGTLWGMFLVENMQALEARCVFGGWEEESWAAANGFLEVS